jgi:hypothetical protein
MVKLDRFFSRLFVDIWNGHFVPPVKGLESSQYIRYA